MNGKTLEDRWDGDGRGGREHWAFYNLSLLSFGQLP
jgi:hypothetical protein